MSFPNSTMQTPRPASVTIFGILNIALASMELFGLLFSVLSRFLFHSAQNPITKAMHDNPDYQTYQMIAIPIGAVAGLALLTSGIGLLFLKNWARQLSLGCGVYKMIAGIVTPFLLYRPVIVPVLDALSKQLKTISLETIQRIALIILVMGAIVSLIYPALLIFFMTRRKVVAAFKPTPLE